MQTSPLVWLPLYQQEFSSQQDFPNATYLQWFCVAHWNVAQGMIENSIITCFMLEEHNIVAFLLQQNQIAIVQVVLKKLKEQELVPHCELDKDGYTLMHHCRTEEAFSLMVQIGFLWSATDAQGDSVLIHHCKQGRAEIVKSCFVKRPKDLIPFITLHDWFLVSKCIDFDSCGLAVLIRILKTIPKWFEEQDVIHCIAIHDKTFMFVNVATKVKSELLFHAVTTAIIVGNETSTKWILKELNKRTDCSFSRSHMIDMLLPTQTSISKISSSAKEEIVKLIYPTTESLTEQDKMSLERFCCWCNFSKLWDAFNIQVSSDERCLVHLGIALENNSVDMISKYASTPTQYLQTLMQVAVSRNNATTVVNMLHHFPCAFEYFSKLYRGFTPQFKSTISSLVAKIPVSRLVSSIVVSQSVSAAMLIMSIVGEQSSNVIRKLLSTRLTYNSGPFIMACLEHGLLNIDEIMQENYLFVHHLLLRDFTQYIRLYPKIELRPHIKAALTGLLPLLAENERNILAQHQVVHLPHYYAIMNECTLLEQELASSQDLQVYDNFGRSCLFYSSSVAALRIALKYSPKLLYSTDKLGNNALCYLLQSDNATKYHMANELISAGLSVTAENLEGLYPLQLLAYCKQEDANVMRTAIESKLNSSWFITHEPHIVDWLCTNFKEKTLVVSVVENLKRVASLASAQLPLDQLVKYAALALQMKHYSIALIFIDKSALLDEFNKYAAQLLDIMLDHCCEQYHLGANELPTDLKTSMVVTCSNKITCSNKFTVLVCSCIYDFDLLWTKYNRPVLPSDTFFNFDNRSPVWFAIINASFKMLSLVLKMPLFNPLMLHESFTSVSNFDNLVQAAATNPYEKAPIEYIVKEAAACNYIQVVAALQHLVPEQVARIISQRHKKDDLLLLLNAKTLAHCISHTAQIPFLMHIFDMHPSYKTIMMQELAGLQAKKIEEFTMMCIRFEYLNVQKLLDVNPAFISETLLGHPFYWKYIFVKSFIELIRKEATSLMYNSVSYAQYNMWFSNDAIYPLHYHVFVNDLVAVRTQIQQNPNSIRSVDSQGRSAIFYITSLEMLYTLHELVPSNFQDVDSHGNTPLIFRLKNNGSIEHDTEIERAMIECGVDIFRANNNTERAADMILDLASRFPNSDQVSKLKNVVDQFRRVENINPMQLILDSLVASVTGDENAHKLVVKRNTAMNDVFYFLQQHFHLRDDWVVSFENEVGIDQGGLLRDLFTTVFKQVVDAKKLEIQEGSRYFIPSSSMTREDAFSIGRLFYKCAFSSKTCIGVNIASYVFEIILNDKYIPTMQDFTQVNPCVAQNVQYVMDNDDCTEEFPYFDELIPVTLENKATLLPQCISNYLIKMRQIAIAGITDGFQHEATNDPEYKKPSPKDLQQLVCGSAHVKPEHVIALLSSDSSVTFSVLKQVLKRFDEQELRRFLYFVTGQRSIATVQNPITVCLVKTKEKSEINYPLPQAQTCTFTMVLAPFTTAHILRAKLLQACSEEQYFGMA